MERKELNKKIVTFYKDVTKLETKELIKVYYNYVNFGLKVALLELSQSNNVDNSIKKRLEKIKTSEMFCKALVDIIALNNLFDFCGYVELPIIKGNQLHIDNAIITLGNVANGVFIAYIEGNNIYNEIMFNANVGIRKVILEVKKSLKEVA